MSKLTEMLNLNYSSPAKVVEHLVSHFADQFKVDVKRVDDLYLFKYGIGCSFQSPMTLECRGSIVRFYPKTGIWKTVSRPYAKFFGLHEAGCVHRTEYIYAAAVKNGMEIVEKADGSCLVLYYDEEYAAWRTSTLGSIDTTAMGDSPMTFSEKFIEVIGGVEAFNAITGFLDCKRTYMFELCAAENRIVNKYPTDCVFYITSRHNDTGVYLTNEELLADYGVMANLGNNIVMPYKRKLSDLGLFTIDQLKEWVEEQAQCTSQYGETPEGFVLYDGNAPVAKIKNARYVIMHSFGCNDILASRNNVIQAFFENTLDDVYDQLPQVLKDFADSLLRKTIGIFDNIRDACQKIEGATFPTQKDYALFVQANADKNFWGFFFSEKEAILDGHGRQFFKKWIFENYKKYLDVWKAQ